MEEEEEDDDDDIITPDIQFQSFEVKATVTKFRAFYTGMSGRNERRKRAKFKTAAVGQRTLDQYLTKPAMTNNDNEVSSQYLKGYEVSRLEIVLESLEGLTVISRNSKSQRKDTWSKFDTDRFRAISLFFEKILDGEGKMAASKDIANILTNGSDHSARLIRYWADCYYEDLLFTSRAVT